MRSVRSLPSRHGPAGRSAAAHRADTHAGRPGEGDRAARRGRRRDEGRVDLRPGPDGLRGHRIRDQAPAVVRRGRSATMSAPITLIPIGRPDRAPRPSVSLTIDGREVTVPEGTTILSACATIGITIPTLCFLETLKPVNVCRLCVVEIEEARVLAPSCSRVVEPGMTVHTRSPRVMLARKLVLELLASSVDLSTAPGMADLLNEYGCQPERFGPAAATVGQPTKIDNDLYVRDYGKCILCYKCVEACGPDHQNTFAIAVAGRGFGAHISTEFDVHLPDSACVYCGNCIAVCPTGALMASREYE